MDLDKTEQEIERPRWVRPQDSKLMQLMEFLLPSNFLD